MMKMKMKMKMILNFVPIEGNINDMLDHMIMVDYKELFQLVLTKNKRFLYFILFLLGTLAPSFELNSKSSIDLIFATYWIHSDTSTLLDADERACIDDGMAKEEDRLKPTNKIVFGMDHDEYEHYIEDLCTNRTRLYETVLKISPDIIDQVQVSMSNPFKKQLGQLTVYRIRLHFKKKQCEQNNPMKCQVIVENKDLLPFKQQIWPAYMGINGDCHANNRF